MPTFYQLADNIKATLSSDGGVVLDLRTGACFALNKIGAEVWERIRQGIPADLVIAALAERHGMSEETASKDIAAFLDDLVRRNLVHPRSAE